ncbi:unnamed protein product [Prorocentrum cordatum]|uniref:Uncharacterized protein n=1 Tax=Prorocentrum cordatum TaxID=2364126 RepID=A0ABN9T2P8_9DINO|nr:unnamed protein product [Polarella glacialis]
MQAMTYVRWGSAKFARGRARFGGENKYNAAAEPSAEDWAFAVTGGDKAKKTTQVPIDITLPAFPKNFSSSQVGAMLKRCNILVNAKFALYFRPAGQNSVVEKYPLYEGYLKPEAGNALWAYLQDSSLRRDAEEFDRLLSFEKRDMAELMGKHMKSTRTAAAARASGDQAAGAAADAPAMGEAVPNPPDDFDEEDFFGLAGGDHDGEGAGEAAPIKRIKTEPGVWKDLKLKPGHNGCIDLSFPSPPQKKKKHDKSLEEELEKIIEEEAQRGGASASSGGAAADGVLVAA